MSKSCFKCGEFKDLDEFYTHPRMADGHLNKCKMCTCRDTKERIERKKKDSSWVAKEAARIRVKNRRFIGLRTTPELRRDAVMKHNAAFPEKLLARQAVQHMKRMKGNHLHHWSYLAEHRRSVIEMTVKDHFKGHRFLVYDQERMMYRRYDTNELLDSLEKHEAFIRHAVATEPD